VLDEHMNNTVFLPAPIFSPFAKCSVELELQFGKKNGNFKCYYCSTFSGWGIIKLLLETSSLLNSYLFEMSKFKEITKDGKVQKLVSLLC